MTPPHVHQSGAHQGRFHAGHLLLLALMLAAAALAWRAAMVAMTPLPSPPPFAAPALADRALLQRFDPFFPARAGSGEGLPVTALPLSLHGVRADSASGRGSAIIAAGDGEQKVYGVGDSIADGATLAAIAADHVVIDRGGTREALWLDSAGAAPVQTFEPGAAPPQIDPNTDPAPPSVLPEPTAPQQGEPAPPGPPAGDEPQ